MLDHIKDIDKCSRVEAVNNLTAVYDKIIGRFNHFTATKRPLSLTAHENFDDINLNSPLEESINLFDKLNVKDTFGISWLEFISLPRDVCRMMIKSASKSLSDKNTAIKNQLDELA